MTSPLLVGKTAKASLNGNLPPISQSPEAAQDHFLTIEVPYPAKGS
jgi:hypothetical protein